MKISSLKTVGASLVLALVFAGSSMALALPPQARAHAQAVNIPVPNTTANQQANMSQASVQSKLAAVQLKVCEKHQVAIKNIITRINERANNQLTLFSTIATRVENFYTSKSKTVSNYTQLTAAINAAKAQAQSDLSSLQEGSTFNCGGNNPMGVVSSFQGYLKTEISDLQNYRTAVKNLIVAVAQANGVTLSSSATKPSTTQGGQQ